MSNSNTLVKTDQQLKTPISFGNNGVKLSSLEDAFRFSNAVVASGWAPKGMEKPEAVLIALQHGAELGLPPMAALQNIAVINGRPGIFGDAALALCRASGLMEYHLETEVGTEGKDDWGFKVVTKRKGGQEATDYFKVSDAKRAGLWAKAGPWSQYPKRMLRFRARGFSLRDNYGDVLKGLRTVEELQDIPREPRDVTPRKSMAQILGGDENARDTIQPRRSDPAPAAYTDAERETFIKTIENHMLDRGLTEKALRLEIRDDIETDAEFSLMEQPTAVLAAIAKHCASKAASETVAGGAK